MAQIDYGQILKRSIELTRKHKWLWIYGATLALFSGGSSGGNGSSSSSNLEKIPKDLPEDLPEKTSYVLGQTTTLLKEWFASVSPLTWVFIALLVVLVIFLMIFVSWIVQSWAKGGLIAGLEDADSGKPTSLLSTSPKGIVKVKHLILLGFISTGVFIALVTIGILGTLMMIFLQQTTGAVGTILLIIWAIVCIVTLILVTIYFSILGIYAERLIVLKHYSPWQAWKKGLSMGRRHFIPTFIMGVINGAVGCSLGCLSTVILVGILGIPAFILVMPYFKDGFRIPPWPVILSLLILFFIFININYLINSILTVFRFSNWNLLFKALMNEEEHRE